MKKIICLFLYILLPFIVLAEDVKNVEDKAFSLTAGVLPGIVACEDNVLLYEGQYFTITVTGGRPNNMYILFKQINGVNWSVEAKYTSSSGYVYFYLNEPGTYVVGNGSEEYCTGTVEAYPPAFLSDNFFGDSGSDAWGVITLPANGGIISGTLVANGAIPAETIEYYFGLIGSEFHSIWNPNVNLWITGYNSNYTELYYEVHCAPNITSADRIADTRFILNDGIYPETTLKFVQPPGELVTYQVSAEVDTNDIRLSVLLSGSQYKVTYTLKKNGSHVSSKQGTGSPLRFENVDPNGVYTIQATGYDWFTYDERLLEMTGTAEYSSTMQVIYSILNYPSNYKFASENVAILLSGSEAGKSYSLVEMNDPETVLAEQIGTGGQISFEGNYGAGTFKIKSEGYYMLGQVTYMLYPTVTLDYPTTVLDKNGGEIEFSISDFSLSDNDIVRLIEKINNGIPQNWNKDKLLLIGNGWNARKYRMKLEYGPNIGSGSVVYDSEIPVEGYGTIAFTHEGGGTTYPDNIIWDIPVGGAQIGVQIQGPRRFVTYEFYKDGVLSDSCTVRGTDNFVLSANGSGRKYVVKATYCGVSEVISVHETETSSQQRHSGLKTHEKVAVLEGGEFTGEFVERAFYYDDRGRVIQTVEKNHLGGISRYSVKYDFAGNVLATRESHKLPMECDPEPDENSDYIPLVQGIYMLVSPDCIDPIGLDMDLIDPNQEYFLSEVYIRPEYHICSNDMYPGGYYSYIPERCMSMVMNMLAVTQPGLYRLVYEVPEMGDEPLLTYFGIMPESSSSMTEFNKLTRYTYDVRGRLLSKSVSVNGGAPVNVDLAYNEMGRLASKTHGDTGIVETYQYTMDGRLKEQDSEIFNLRVRYEHHELTGTPDLYTGGITEVEWTNKLLSTESNAYSFSYDLWGQLSESRHFVDAIREDDFYESGMTYDSNGNILSLQRYADGGLKDDLEYRYNGNKLFKTSQEGAPFLYDSNGNMTKDGRISLKYHWNCLDLLGKVTDPDDEEIVRYTWLADGSKCAVRDAGGNGFAYLGSLVYVLEQDSVRVESTGFAGGRMVASETQDGTVFNPVWLMTDYLGSVRAVVAGDQIAYNNYYPYGGRWNDGSAEPTRWLYNGKELQVTGDLSFLDFGSRMYDPDLGRWVNTDPAMQAYSPYLFCANSPMMYADPDGEFWHIVAGAIFGGVSNFIANRGNIHSVKDGLISFGIGAAAGALGAGIGAGSNVAMAGGSFGAGFIGTAAGVSSTGFIAGAATGASAAFATGFITGAGNAWYEGVSFRDGLLSGIQGGGMGALYGGVVGGVVGGIDALGKGTNFWTGKSTFDISKGIGATGFNPKNIGDNTITGKYVGAFEGVNVYESTTLGYGQYSGGIALPERGIIVGEKAFTGGVGLRYDALLQHEFGHVLQYRLIGPAAYYAIVGKDSFVSAAFDGVGGWQHENLWAEKWANYLSDNYFGSRSLLNNSAWPAQDISMFNKARIVLFNTKLILPFVF